MRRKKEPRPIKPARSAASIPDSELKKWITAPATADLARRPRVGLEFVMLSPQKTSMALLLGLNMPQYYNLERSGGIKFNPEGHPQVGGIDVISTVSSHCRGLREALKEAQTQAKITSRENADPEGEFRRQRTRMARLQADKLEGSLCSAEDMVEARTNEVLRAKARLTALGSKVLAEISPYLIELPDGKALINSVIERVDGCVEETLMELARVDDLDEELEESEGDEEDLEDLDDEAALSE